MAANSRHDRRSPKRPRPSHPLRQHRQEKMGRKLSLHGPLRIRSRNHLLGDMGLQDVLRPQTPPLLGKSWTGFRPEVPDPAGGAAGDHAPLPQWYGSDGDD